MESSSAAAEDPKAAKLGEQRDERKVEDEQQQQQQQRQTEAMKAPEEASSLEDDEAQEDTQSSTLVEPPVASQDQIDEDEQVEEPESLDRRAFNGPDLLAREVKKLRNGSKLFSKGNQSARKRRRRRKRVGRVPLLKSSLTRQSSTTTANYAGLELAGEQLAANPISSSIKQHLPKVLSNPLQISSAVQKLIMNKISPQQANSLQYRYHPHQQRDPKAHNQQLFGHATGFMESPLEGGPSHWSPSEDAPTYISSKHRHRHHALGADGGKMIPIEILGLDPAVASSILGGSSDSLNSVGALQGDSSQQYNQAATSDHKYQPTAAASRPKSSSILHIHHFHHQGKQPQAGRPGQPAEQPQHVNYQAQQQSEEQAEAPASSSGSANEVQQVAGGHKQAFLNERGELVYLAVEEQAPTRQTGAGESDKYQDVVSVSQHNAESLSAGSQEAAAAAAEDMESYQPGVQNATADLSPMMHRLKGHRGAHHVQLEASAQGDSVAEVGGDLSGDKLVMVSYKPANATGDEAESLKSGPYNEGQESNQVSAKHQLSSAALQQFGNQQQDDRVALFGLAAQPVDGPPVSEAGRAQRLVSLLPNLISDGNASSEHMVPPPRGFNLVPSTILSPLTSSALRAQNDIVARSPWLLPTLPHSNGYGDKLFLKPFPLLTTNHSYSYDQQQNFLEKLALLRHINQLNSGRQQLMRQQSLRSSPNSNSNNNLFATNSSKLTNQEFMLMLNEQLKQTNNNSSSSSSSPIAAAAAAADLFNITALANTDPTQNSSGNRFELAQASDDSPPKFLKSVFSSDPSKINQNQHQRAIQHHKSIAPADLQTPPIKRQPVLAQDTDTFSLNDTSGVSNIALAFICIISMVTLIIIAASMFYRHRRRNSGRCAELTLGKTRLTRRTKRFARSSFESNDGTSIKSISLGGSASSGSNLSPNEGNINASSNMNHLTVGRRTGELQGANGLAPLSTFTRGDSSSPDKYQFADDPDIKTLNTRVQKLSYFKSLISSRQADCSAPNKKPGAGCGLNGPKTSDSNSCYLNVKQRPPKVTSVKQLRSNGLIQDLSSRLSHSFKDSSIGDNAGSSNFTARNPACSKNESSEYLASRHSFESKYNANRMPTIHSINNRINKHNAPPSSDNSKKPSLSGGYGPHKRLTSLPAPKNVVASLTASYKSGDASNGHGSQVDRL